MAHQLPRRDDFRIAIICALPLEYDAIALATARIGSHNVVLLLLPDRGKVSAASAAASLQSTYTGIELAILTGICGGVPTPGANNELLLGDVIISKSIVQYDLGRQYHNGFAKKDTVEDILGRPNREIRSLVATFKTRQGRRDLQRRAGEILTEIQQKAANDGDQTLYQQPISAEDLLLEPGYLHGHRDRQSCSCSESGACETARNASCKLLQCDERRLVPRERLLVGRRGDDCLTREPQVFIGRIGSGDTVMKSGVDRDRIAAEHGLIAFEMEGAGIYDYADSHKNKDWQNYAAATAASTTKAVLEHYTSTRRDKPTTTRSHFVVPYNRNSDFIGRSGALDHLKWQFGHDQQQGGVKARSRIALHGLGGVGKTQIALEYVYWLKETRPDVSVYWVHASNAQRIRQAYASIAEECDIPGRDDPKVDHLMLVKNWLEKGDRGPWLMVVYNADDTHLFFQTQEACQADTPPDGLKEEGNLGRYIPECRRGSVLITARNQQTGSRLAPGKPATKVNKLTNDEADQLIRSMLEELDRTISAADISTLSSRLEHLPLVLAQAAALIQENEISIAQYVKLLDKSNSSLVEHLSQPFEAVGRDSSTPHALADAVASDVLSLLSFFDRQAIPYRFINDYFRHQHPHESETNIELTATKALGTLKAFSLITEAKDESLDIHRLVQAVTRKWLINKQRASKFAQQALQIVSDAYPFGRHVSRDTCREYLPHAYTVLQNEGTAAEKRLAQALKLQKRALGEEHPDTHNSMTGLALSYHLQGRDLEIRLRVLGEEHPSTLTSIGNLVLTYYRQVLETRRRVLGEEHPFTLNSMANLAVTYRCQGRLQEAEALAVQVMETKKRVLSLTVIAQHDIDFWPCVPQRNLKTTIFRPLIWYSDSRYTGETPYIYDGRESDLSWMIVHTPRNSYFPSSTK
ncbi:phosphorylase superfamily protein [Colletotrichum incanum]|nr:phosphorylase superfamily protein [Colletotrichum incanum]